MLNSLYKLILHNIIFPEVVKILSFALEIAAKIETKYIWNFITGGGTTLNVLKADKDESTNNSGTGSSTSGAGGSASTISQLMATVNKNTLPNSNLKQDLLSTALSSSGKIIYQSYGLICALCLG